MPKYDGFDLDVQNTTKQSNAVQPNSYLTIPAICMLTQNNCTAVCLSNGCTGVCPGPTYDYNCKGPIKL